MLSISLLFIIISSSIITATEYPSSIDDNINDYYDWERSRYYNPTMMYYNTRRYMLDNNSVNLGRTRIGQGIFRILSGGRDAELRCDFSTHDLVSNVIWERVTDPAGRSYSLKPFYLHDYGRNNNYIYPGVGNYYNGRTAVLQRADGASLYLRDISPSDAGVYRCLASRRVPQSVGRWSQAVETIFQDIYFFPTGPAALADY